MLNLFRELGSSLLSDWGEAEAEVVHYESLLRMTQDSHGPSITGLLHRRHMAVGEMLNTGVVHGFSSFCLSCHNVQGKCESHWEVLALLFP